MASSAPTLATRWEPLPPRVIAELLGPSSARWWLSGGVALDHWLGTNTREHDNIDVSTTIADLPQVVQDLPARRAHGYCRSTSRTARIASGFIAEIPDCNCRGIVQ